MGTSNTKIPKPNKDVKVILEGYLLKRSIRKGKAGGWQKRYYRLYDVRLFLLFILFLSSIKLTLIRIDGCVGYVQEEDESAVEETYGVDDSGRLSSDVGSDDYVRSRL
jgi:hypothetical protein